MAFRVSGGSFPTLTRALGSLGSTGLQLRPFGSNMQYAPAAAGLLSFSAGSYSGFEGGVAEFAVGRTGGAVGAIAVDWSISVSEGAPTPSNGTITWNNSEAGAKQVSVVLGIVTADRVGSIALSNPRSLSGGAAPAIVTGSTALTILNDTSVPSQPTLGTPIVESSSTITVPLAFGSTDAQSGILDHALEQAIGSGSTTFTQIAQGASIFPRVVADLSPATTHRYRARGRNRAGLFSIYSAIVEATTQGTSLVAGYLDYYGLDPDRYIAPDATGSGNGLSALNPWTWNQMLASATPGMVVGAAAGVYTRTNSGSNSIPSFNIPTGVTIVCHRAAAYHPTGRSEFRNGVTSGNGCPTIGAHGGKNSTRWIGAYVNESVSRSTSDTGLVSQHSSNNGEYHGLLLEALPVAREDNKNIFRAELTTNWLLKNSILRDNRHSSSASQNFGAVMTYDSVGGWVDHCELFDNDVDFFPKGKHTVSGQGFFRVTNCRSERATLWLHLGGNSDPVGWPMSLYQKNLVIDAVTGLYVHTFTAGMPPSGDGHPWDNTMEDNTFIRVGLPNSPDLQAAITWGFNGVNAHNLIMRRNLWWNCPVVHDWSQLSMTDLTRIVANGCRSDQNHTHGEGNFARVGGRGSRTLANFRQDTIDAGASPAWEVATTQGDPQFVNAAAGDFRLQTGSPATGKGCYQLASDSPGLER